MLWCQLIIYQLMNYRLLLMSLQQEIWAQMQGPLPPRWGCCGCQRPIRVCGLQPVFCALGNSWHANCVPPGWSRAETVDLTDADSSAVSSCEAAVAASSGEAEGAGAAEATADPEGAGAAEAAAVSWPPVVASLATWHKHSRRWLSDRSRSR